MVKCSIVEIIALENRQLSRSFETRSDSTTKHWLRSRSWTICANGSVVFISLMSDYSLVQDHEEKHHVIKMTEHFYFRGHLCIAMELLSINLYELIKANGFVGFTTALIRRFTSQMLGSLQLMRHHRIVHCDLKPEVCLRQCPWTVSSTEIFWARTFYSATQQRALSKSLTSVVVVLSTKRVRTFFIYPVPLV